MANENKITAMYTHGKFGKFMFKLCAKATMFLVKHKELYYILNFTWGIIMTFIGLVIALIMSVVAKFDKKNTISKYNWAIEFRCYADYWGGFSIGFVFLRDRSSADSVSAHEFGHTFQNCLFGPLMPFLVAIPSAVRWWYRDIKERKGETVEKAYDAMWFEDAATQCGEYANKYLNS